MLAQWHNATKYSQFNDNVVSHLGLDEHKQGRF